MEIGGCRLSVRLSVRPSVRALLIANFRGPGTLRDRKSVQKKKTVFPTFSANSRDKKSIFRKKKIYGKVKKTAKLPPIKKAGDQKKQNEIHKNA